MRYPRNEAKSSAELSNSLPTVLYSVKVENKQNRPAHFPKATEHALGEAEGALRVPGGGPGYTGAGCGSLTRHRAVFQL